MSWCSIATFTLHLKRALFALFELACRSRLQAVPPSLRPVLVIARLHYTGIRIMEALAQAHQGLFRSFCTYFRHRALTLLTRRISCGQADEHCAPTTRESPEAVIVGQYTPFQRISFNLNMVPFPVSEIGDKTFLL